MRVRMAARVECYRRVDVRSLWLVQVQCIDGHFRNIGLLFSQSQATLEVSELSSLISLGADRLELGLALRIAYCVP